MVSGRAAAAEVPVAVAQDRVAAVTARGAVAAVPACEAAVELVASALSEAASAVFPDQVRVVPEPPVREQVVAARSAALRGPVGRARGRAIPDEPAHRVHPVHRAHRALRGRRGRPIRRGRVWGRGLLVGCKRRGRQPVRG